ncbi:hypothetical protein Aph01nite_45910 [Acrocarpospora phusangensis]|uniref:Uncharacterized protein n=1 Tax=Acrocarpospora phusangensis TaxID=1070424 RepID=A0A919ULK5_9ACTN|nr:hypothetical protein [Acrocarpospora phusangensis]GIH26281.1 hypothetical protein Aph01nite_45910 [Acrocarpospora phusangensis]
MPTPLTPDEKIQFKRGMTDFIAQKLAAGESFRVSTTAELEPLYHEVTSMVSARLGRPVTGFTNGRDFFISLPQADELTGGPAQVTARQD